MVTSCCTLLMWMYFSSNPQNIYRWQWSKCPGSAPMSKPRTGRDRGTLPLCKRGAVIFPRHHLVRETRFQPCAPRAEKKGMPPHSLGEAKQEFSPTAAGERGLWLLPRDCGSFSLLTQLLAGLARQAGCFQPWGAQGLITSTSCTGMDLQSLELGSTNYGSVASCFSVHFVLHLLFPSMSAGRICSPPLFQIC